MTQLDKEFSHFLLQQVNKTSEVGFDLRESGDLFSFPHPLVLKAQISHQINPQQEYPVQHTFMGQNLFCFADREELLNSTWVKAHPYQVFHLLQDKPLESMLDFGGFGCVKITQNKILEPTMQGLHQKTLPILLNYVFSDDLWGEQGKWIRFHRRLNRIFEKYELISSATQPGFYPLIKKASKLEQFGFQGDNHGDTYTLTLPWTFPLTGLVRLENIVEQEF